MDLKDPSTRRFIVIIATLATPFLKNKLGLDQETVELIVEGGLAYLLLSNGKQVMVANAEAKGAAAAQSVKLEDVQAIIKQAIEAEKAKVDK